MTTKVFISWSGELSQNLAKAIRNWLPSALQFVKPYFTPDDIEKGTKWSSEISTELEQSNVGIICLTNDNINNPWILFEAGALSKNIKHSHVCTLLFNLEPAQISGPLSSFQATKFVKEDFKKIVQTINATANERKLETAVLDDVFETWWPKLDKQINEILKNPPSIQKSQKRDERDILEEILELSKIN